MLISDAYSWGPNNILEVVVIPYYGYICSDDDGPDHYVFNPHPYGVVDLDAYYGGNLPDEDLKTIIVVEYYYGRNGKTRSNDNDSPEGVVYCKIDAYLGSIYADDMLICLSWWGYFNNWSYKNADKNGVVDLDAYFTDKNQSEDRSAGIYEYESGGNYLFTSDKNIFGVV